MSDIHRKAHLHAACVVCQQPWPCPDELKLRRRLRRTERNLGGTVLQPSLPPAFLLGHGEPEVKSGIEEQAGDARG